MLGGWLRDLGEPHIGAGVAGILGILVRADTPLDRIADLLLLAREKAELHAATGGRSVKFMSARWWVPGWVRNGAAWFTSVVRDVARRGAQLNWDLGALRDEWLLNAEGHGTGADEDSERIEHDVGGLGIERNIACDDEAEDPHSGDTPIWRSTDEPSPRSTLQEALAVVNKPGNGWYSVDAAWRAALERLRRDVTDAQYETWLRGTRLLGSANGDLALVARTKSARDILSARFTPHLVSALAAVTGSRRTVRIVTVDQLVTEGVASACDMAK